MRRRSKKQAAAYREHEPMRLQFLADMQYSCAICGASDVACHEITPGKNRMRAFGRREALLPACWACNSLLLVDRASWPLARQCAVKLLVDPEWFSLDVINEILAPGGHPNPPQVVTPAEVLEWVAIELQERRYAA